MNQLQSKATLPQRSSVMNDQKSSYIFVIEGNPIALARPRLNESRFYDAQKHQKVSVGINLKRDYPHDYLLSTALHLDATFYMNIPRTTRHKPNNYHVYKPDLSNLLKWIEDCLTGVIISDDCIIASTSCHKIYSKQPKTIITLTLLPETYGQKD